MSRLNHTERELYELGSALQGFVEKLTQWPDTDHETLRRIGWLFDGLEIEAKGPKRAIKRLRDRFRDDGIPF